MTQPVGRQTGGSVFRNPTEIEVSAAELIEKAGLKGVRVGGATVSEMHANLFVNTGDASSKDMLELVSLVKDKSQ